MARSGKVAGEVAMVVYLKAVAVFVGLVLFLVAYATTPKAATWRGGEPLKLNNSGITQTGVNSSTTSLGYRHATAQK